MRWRIPALAFVVFLALLAGVCWPPESEGRTPCGPHLAACLAALHEFGLDDPPWVLHAFDATMRCESQYANVRGNIDGRDRGVWQINAAWHPEVSDAQAFDPAWASRWAAWQWASGRAWLWACWEPERWGPSWQLTRPGTPREFPAPGWREARRRALIVNEFWLPALQPLPSAPSRRIVPWWKWATP